VMSRTSEIAVEGLLGELKSRVAYANLAFQVKQTVDDMLLVVQQRFCDDVVKQRQQVLTDAQQQLEEARKALADMQKNHDVGTEELKQTLASSQSKSIEIANHIAALQSQIQQLEEDHKTLDYKQNLAQSVKDV
jgi:DNA repair exonuclease SbcCD ATPase subunit